MPGPGALDQVWEHPVFTATPVVECGEDVFGGVRRDERFTVASPSGPREFRFLVAEAPPNNLRAAAVLDEQRACVLLSLTEKLDGKATVEQELEPLRRAEWGALTAYINRHDKRRCDLPVDGNQNRTPQTRLVRDLTA